MREQIRTGLMIGVGLVLLVFTGCFFEKIAWSPDGRSIVYADYSDHAKLWLCDVTTNRTRNLPLAMPGKDGGTVLIAEPVESCRYLPSGEEILVSTHKEGGQSNLYLLNTRTELCDQIASDTLPCFNVSRDGERVFYTKKTDEGCSLMEYTRRNGERKRFTWPEETFFFALDPEEKRIAYCPEGQGLCMLDTDKGTTTCLLAGENRMFYWPKWKDKRTLLFIHRWKDQEPEDVGELQTFSLDRKTTHTLCRNVSHVYSPLSLSSDGKSVVVTAAHLGPNEEFDKNRPKMWQVALVNVNTAATSWLTDYPFGAVFPAWSPEDGRVAYLSGVTEGGVLNVLGVAAKRTVFTWRNKEERLFADAESAFESGENETALTGWRQVADNYPESQISNAARYRVAVAFAKKSEEDVEAAYLAWQQITDAKLREQFRPLFEGKSSNE
jgi:Tol biopolymer transport system component